jgi:hypothetical protein
MYILIVFSDLEQTEPIFIGTFNKIKDIIKFSDGVIRYTDSYYKPLPTSTKHKTVKKLFKIVKI